MAKSLVIGLPDEVRDCIAVRRVNGVMQIAVKSSAVDFWYSTGEIESDIYTIDNISYGSESIVIDTGYIDDYVNALQCSSYKYVIAEPSDVEGCIEV